MANYIGNVPASGEFKRLDSIASSFDGTTSNGLVESGWGGTSFANFMTNSVNDEPLDDPTTLKVRYRTCQLCPWFDQEKKVCDDCECFMPIKVQFKKCSCPQGKWDAIPLTISE